MKKIIAILSVFIGIGLIVSFITGFAGAIPASVPESSAFVYKLMKGLQNFGRYIPGVAITGFTVSRPPSARIS